MHPLPDRFAATRDSMHALAEQVISAARYRATERIGLRPTPGGFGTPLDDAEVVRVDGIELVHTREGDERRAPISTLAAAAEFVGVPLGAPPVYTPATKVLPDASLTVDPDAAGVLAAWFAYAGSLLADLRSRHPAEDGTEVQLWPEHFDLAIELGDEAAGTRANFGASPGDATIASPYLYVGPWREEKRTGELGAYDFGAAITYEELSCIRRRRSRCPVLRTVRGGPLRQP